MHPLAKMVSDCAEGRFPTADGGWHRVPPWHDEIEAVIAFTGHAVFAVRDDVGDDWLALHSADGFGGAHHPRLVTQLVGPRGWIDSLDVLLVGRGTGLGSPLMARPDLAGLDRVRHAAAVREVQQVLGYADPTDSSVVIIACGVGGLTELSFELDRRFRGQGHAARLVEDALATLEPDQLVVAAVAPGNAASLRAVLSTELLPVGSIQLLRR